ncbi:alpha/beta fold hydrolase [uncultured Aquabacterium sp.]|uniref:alpha/beta hydrolase family protein n=1 Tax=uncultured Aquabacterium sp. TaxID=158753 RepID=UPI0026292354|nr:alpha/beta fold hydrolase [uncultured Aquabacterium sp.]
MSTPVQAPERVEITCADGTVLAGHFVTAAPGVDTGRPLPVLVCPATGVRQQFYLRFAAWLAEHGHDVLVFDYRGVGLSLQGPLKTCRATLAEWGQQDQVAALDWLLARTGQPQVLLVGHSAGGQMIGLLPNHDRIARVVGVAASTGWFKGMRPGFRMQANLAFRAFIPLGIRLKGYAPCSRLGLGEDLPAAVATQWGQWCAAGGYATNAVKRQPDRDFHAAVRTPVTVFHATDDDIATPATVADLMRTWPQADKRVVRVSPREHGLKAIGHINWFRSSHQALWPLIGQALRG